MGRSPRSTRSSRVGIREAKSGLSALIRRVKGGETIELTDRGRPVARVVPIAPDERTEDEVLQNLLDRGLVRKLPPKGPIKLPRMIKPKKPVDLQRMLREDRDRY